MVMAAVNIQTEMLFLTSNQAGHSPFYRPRICRTPPRARLLALIRDILPLSQFFLPLTVKHSRPSRHILEIYR